MSVFGYVRVSTGRQAEEGESLDVQERRIRGWSASEGLEVDLIHVERGVSGAKPLGERPEGQKLLAALKAGDVLIAPKLDRLFRSALDALQVTTELQRRGVRVVLLDLGGDITNGLGKVFFTIAAAFAEAERDRIRERITEVKADQRQRNRYLGGIVPFGFKVGERGELVEDADQQRAIRDMAGMRAAGQSLRTIAVTMTTRGFRLTHAGVAKIITAAQERAPVQRTAA